MYDDTNQVRTVEDIYKWAKEHDCLDKPIYKHNGAFRLFQIRNIMYFCKNNDIIGLDDIVVID